MSPQRINKYPNVCYHCQYLEFKRRAENAGMEVRLYAPGGGGVDIFICPHGTRRPTPHEFKVGWLPAVPDHCTC